MYRITEKMLESRVNHLNKLTNSPETSYTKSESGQYVANIGNYHLSFAYGGVALERMECAGGSVSGPSGGGASSIRFSSSGADSFGNVIKHNNEQVPFCWDQGHKL